MCFDMTALADETPPTLLVELPAAALDSAVCRHIRASVRKWLDRYRDASGVISDGDALTLWRLLGRVFAEAGLVQAREAADSTPFWTAMSVVAEELGSVAADVPFLSSVAVGSTIARVSGDRELAARLITGQSTAAWLGPYTEFPCGMDTGARFDRNRLWASACDVAGAAQADILICLHGDTVFTVRSDQVHLAPSMATDSTRNLCDVRVDGAPVTILCDGPRASRAVTMAANAGATMLAIETLSRAMACARLHESPLGDLDNTALRAHSATRYALMCLATNDPFTGVAATTALIACSAFVRAVLRSISDPPYGVESFRRTALLERLRADAMAWGGLPAARRMLAAQLVATDQDWEGRLL